jgi:multidrug efflux system membrane fusion protein
MQSATESAMHYQRIAGHRRGRAAPASSGDSMASPASESPGGQPAAPTAERTAADKPAVDTPASDRPAPDRPARRSSRRRRLWWAGLACLLAIGAWLLMRAWQKPPPPNPRPPIPVAVAVAQAGDVPIYLDGIGTVQAYNTVTVRAQVDGTLSKISFVEGQDVKAGDVLAQIDPRPLRAQLNQAIAAHARDAAQLANAKVDMRRYTTLVAQDSIATQQLDTQRALVAQNAATVQNDQAQIDYARVQLSHTTIVSPIAGRTGVRQVDAGNIVRAADTTGIVTVTQIEPISVLFTLPGDAVGPVLLQMKGGTLTVSAMLRNDTKPIAQGQLLLVNNQIDATTGTVQLKATFPNKEHALWPGQFVDVRLLLETRRNAVTIPSGAVQRGPQGLFVYVVAADGTAQMRPIRMSASNSGSGVALIEAGVAAGDRVVTDGHLKLRPGARVRLVQPGGAPARPAASTSAS